MTERFRWSQQCKYHNNTESIIFVTKNIAYIMTLKDMCLSLSKSHIIEIKDSNFNGLLELKNHWTEMVLEIKSNYTYMVSKSCFHQCLRN